MTALRWLPATLAACCLGISSAALAQLTEREKKGVEDALYVGNLGLSDLSFARRPYSDAYRLSIVDLAIDRPIEAANRLLKLHQDSLRYGVPQLLSAARTELLDDAKESLVAAARPGLVDLPSLPTELRKPVGELVLDVWSANEAVSASLSNLTDEEVAKLYQGLPGWAVEDASVKFGWVQGAQQSQDELLRLASRVNLAMQREAAVKLATAIQQRSLELKKLAVSSKWTGSVSFSVLGLKIKVSGIGDDRHAEMDTHLTIDLGGNDRYLGRAGGGMGRCSLLMDFGGDDIYKVPDLSAGAGLLGIGFAYDFGGLDVFRGRSLCFGAGLAGVGVFLKDGGHDRYFSTSLAQGYGQFGIGLLLDTRGDDGYELGVSGQGAARTQGVGWLQDRGGRDVYHAGGLLLNSPLFKDVTYSNAQGYGSGYREDTGGISGGVGLLTDPAGDDSYLGDTYCQAASYWFALGTLWDGGGHDTYRAYHYAQSSAMHMTATYLFDLAGDDLYSVAYGAAHSIGHDYGTSFLLDREGSDVYAARDSQPGVGNANGLALFIDAQGDDRYAGPPGSANPARGSGSLGVFVDLGGADKYRDGLADGQAAERPTWAVALDLADLVATPATVASPTERPVAGSKPNPGAAKIAELYGKATQWGVGTAVNEVETAIRELISIGMPAYEWMVKNKLPKASRLEQRAFVQVATGIGESARALSASRVASEDDEEAKVALLVCIDGNFAEGGPFIPDALQRPRLQRYASRAAGLLKSRESVPALMILTADPDRITALSATVSLGQIADPSSYSTAEALLAAPDLPIRKAAIGALAKFPEQALVTAERLVKENDERRVRLGIELYSAIGSDAALTACVGLLNDPRPGVRIATLLALDGRVPDTAAAVVLERKNDTHLLVRAVAARIRLTKA